MISPYATVNLSGSPITVESGAVLTLDNAKATGATIINNGTVNVTNSSAVNIAAGSGHDTFVFAANFGQTAISLQVRNGRDPNRSRRLCKHGRSVGGDA